MEFGALVAAQSGDADLPKEEGFSILGCNETALLRVVLQFRRIISTQFSQPTKRSLSS
jgi:hypothetical protein